MIGYLIVIIITLMWYFICRKSKYKSDRTFLFGMACLLTLFYGLRGENVGSDTLSYISMFQKDGSQSIKMLWEYMWTQKSPAYVLSEWIVYQLIPSSRVWIFITSAFFFFVFSDFLYKYSEDTLYSYLLFFTIFGTFQMTGIRQSIAMAILMIAYDQINKKRMIRYIIYVYIAYLFHQSALVFLPMYWLFKRKVRMHDIAIVTCIVIIIYVNRNDIFNYIKSFTSYYYFEDLSHSEPINFSIMIYSATLLGYMFCIAIERSDKKGQRENSAYAKLRNMDSDEKTRYSQYTQAMYFASMFMPLVAVNGAVRRIVMYFAIYMILLIPKGLKAILPPTVHFFAKLGLMLLLIILFMQATSTSSYQYSLYLFT